MVCFLVKLAINWIYSSNRLQATERRDTRPGQAQPGEFNCMLNRSQVISTQHVAAARCAA